METSNKHSWLVAAWPGMGNVAVIAASYLASKLNCLPVGELELPEHFDIAGIDVAKGVVARPHMPRSVFHRPTSALASGSQLTVFLGEAQPSHAGYRFAHAILDRANEWGVDRVVTFASMASQLHPSQQPRVFGAATKPELIDEMRRLEVSPLEEGQIGGMNGVLLGAAMERGIPGLCLLGEIPFFAAGVANPKAARAVLDAFALLAGIEIDLDELLRHAEVVDRALIDLFERMKSQAEGGDSGFEESARHEEPLVARETPESLPEKPEPKIDEAVRARIERLFEETKKDRARAMSLKQELDRLGVFKQYENRFLDLFKRAE